MVSIFKNLYTIRNVFYILTEGIFIYLSVILTGWILLGDTVTDIGYWLHLKSLMIAFTCIFFLYVNSVYDISLTQKYSELSIRLMQSFGYSLIFLAIIYAFFQNMIICRGFFFIYLPVAMMLIALWRFLYLIILKNGIFNKKVVLVGFGEIATNIAKIISEEIDCGYTLVAVISGDGDNDFKRKKCGSYNQISGMENLYKTVRETGVSKIIVAMKERRGQFPSEELLRCRIEGYEIIDGNSFYEMLQGKLIVSHTNPTWFIFSEGFKKSILKSAVKRIEDVIISAILLLALSPVMLLTAIAVKVESRGPVFYSQERLGKRKKPYMVYKFRSMAADAEKETGPVWASKNDTRITRVGNIIRKCRIDEIPQLWCVLKGDMSLVGPRPERKHFVDKLEKIVPYYAERFAIKPGVTGWAQVCYSYGDTVDDAIEKLNYDLFYSKHMSVLFDIVILFRTVKTVLSGFGAQ